MKLVRITTRIYPDLGGPAKHAFNISQFSANPNLQIVAISCLPKSEKKGVKEVQINENFKIVYLPFYSPKLNANFLALSIFFIKFFIYGLFSLIRINKEEKIDLIHVHTPAPSGYIAYVFKIFYGVPYVYTIHGMDYGLSFLLLTEIKIVGKSARSLIVISRSIKDFLINNMHLKKKIYWIPNGINTSEYYHISSKKQKIELINKLKLQDKICQNDFIIIYVGYMIFRQKVKGMIDFLNGFKLFIDKIGDKEEKKKIKLLFIGAGKFLRLLEEEKNRLNLNNNVFLLGHRYNIKDLLAISDLSGLTSYVEGFPNVILEYMASGVPCIGSNVGEIKTIIRTSGFLIKPGDVESIYKNINLFYHSKELRNSLKLRSVKIIKELFEWKKIAENINKIYKKS